MVTQIYAAAVAALSSKKGAAMVEYALLAALIAVVATAAITGLGTNVTAKFTTLRNSLR